MLPSNDPPADVIKTEMLILVLVLVTRDPWYHNHQQDKDSQDRIPVWLFCESFAVTLLSPQWTIATLQNDSHLLNTTTSMLSEEFANSSLQFYPQNIALPTVDCIVPTVSGPTERKQGVSPPMTCS